MACDFPARQLLEQARRITTETDPLGDPAKLTYACGFIKAIGDLHRYHEDLTGCQCWYEALGEEYERKPVRRQSIPDLRRMRKEN